ncbi:hypothetical protein [Aquamicrobium sp. LC103]|nr:hypothetical protein [Aquamicrobium sp. LC103]
MDKATAESRFDLVVLEVMMPGEDLCASLQRTDNPTSSRPLRRSKK